MSGNIRVGIIGAGSISISHARAYRKCGGVEVAAVCDIVPHRAERLVKNFGFTEAQVYTDYMDVLSRDDIDAVSICTPNDLHHPMTMAAIGHGKHVLCEKPLAMNAAQAREMAEGAMKAKLVGMTGFTYHYIPSFEFACKLARDGEFGDIHRIKAEYTMGIYSRESRDGAIHWRLLKAHSGGGVTGDLAAHILHLSRVLFGEAKAVSARLSQMIPFGEENTQADLLIEYQNGVLGNVEASWMAPGRNNFQRLEVSGSKGAFIYQFCQPCHLDIYSGQGLGRLTNDFMRVEVPGAPNFTPEFLGFSWQNQAHDWAMLKEINCFLQCIREGRYDGGVPSFYDGLKVQEIVDAAAVSSASGQRVNLD